MGWPYCLVDNTGSVCCPFRISFGGVIKWDGRCFRNSRSRGLNKISINSYFAVVKEVSGESVIDLKLLKTDEQFLAPTSVIGSMKGFNFVEFWESFWKCSYRLFSF